MNIDNKILDSDLIEDDLLDDDFLSGILDEDEDDGLPEFDTYDDIDE